MTDGSPRVLTRVSWKDLVPGLLLLRAPGIAIDAGSVLLGTIGVWLVPLGWWLAGRLFYADTPLAGPGRSAVVPVTLGGMWFGNRHPIGWFGMGPIGPGEMALQGTSVAQPPVAPSFTSGVLELDGWVLAPLTWVLMTPLSIRSVAYLLFGLIWTVAVMALVGGPIVRKAVVRLGTDQRIGLIDGAKYAWRRFASLLLAPLLPLLGALPFAVVLAVGGLLMRTDAGAAAAGVLWIVLVAIAFPLTIIAIGGLLGWPLMAPRVLANNTDSFGAVSGAYAFGYGRPWRLLAYAVVAGVLGTLAIFAFSWLIEILLILTIRGVGLGASEERLVDVALSPATGSVSRAGVAFATTFVRSTVAGFALSYFWTAVSAIYLLLRMDVDHEEFDHIHFDEEERTLDPRRPDRPAEPVQGDERSAKPVADGPVTPPPSA